MTTDTFCHPFRGLIDPFGFMSDQLDVSSVLYVKSQTADAPFPICSFNRKKNIVGSDNAYTVDVQSRRMLSVRYAKRTYEISQVGVESSTAKAIGMKECEMSVVDDSLLHMIHIKLEVELHMSMKTEEGLRIAIPYFYPYLNS